MISLAKPKHLFLLLGFGFLDLSQLHAQFTDRRVLSPLQSMQPPQKPGLQSHSLGGPINLDRYEPTSDAEFPASSLKQNTPNNLPIDRPFEPAEMIAYVGTQVILAGDLYSVVDPRLASSKSSTSPEVYQERRRQLVRLALRQYVSTLCLKQEFFKENIGIKGTKDAIAKEGKLNINISKTFYEKYAPMLMKNSKVETLKDLEIKLIENGTSIEGEKSRFAEQVLAGEMLRKKVNSKPDIPLYALRQFYQDHINEYQRPARVKYRQISVMFSKHSTRQEAEQKIRLLWDELVLGGNRFDTVAIRDSEGPEGKAGGFHDWTTQGSLRSESIDRAIFALDLRKLIYIGDDDQGLHILEILEREPASVASFEQVQIEIKKQLETEFADKQEKDLIDKICKATPIWTLWPEDIPGSMPLSEVAPHVSSRIGNSKN